VALNLIYVICNVEKFAGRFINPRSPLKRETGMGNGEKGGREWKREGKNDRRRRLNVGKEGQEGKGKKEKEREWIGREGICPIFESLQASTWL
jgi:hypothetical protein